MFRRSWQRASPCHASVPVKAVESDGEQDTAPHESVRAQWHCCRADVRPASTELAPPSLLACCSPSRRRRRRDVLWWLATAVHGPAIRPACPGRARRLRRLRTAHPAITANFSRHTASLRHPRSAVGPLTARRQVPAQQRAVISPRSSTLFTPRMSHRRDAEHVASFDDNRTTSFPKRLRSQSARSFQECARVSTATFWNCAISMCPASPGSRATPVPCNNAFGLGYMSSAQDAHCDSKVA
jgi:hypothetical protein